MTKDNQEKIQEIRERFEQSKYSKMLCNNPFQSFEERTGTKAVIMYESDVEFLLSELDAAKQENERLKRENQDLADKYNDTVYGLESLVESLQQRLKQVEEAIQVAYNIAYENFETVNQMDLIRLTLGDTLSLIRGEANKEENA